MPEEEHDRLKIGFFFRRRYLNAVLVAAFLFTSSASYGHTAIDEQIQSVNVRINEAPTDYLLYLRRANLNRIHGDWDASLADYAKAEEFGPEELTQDLYFYRGRVWFDAGNYRLAREALDHFLKIRPDHYEARLTSARTWVALHNTDAATSDFSYALQLAENPSPDLYLERSAVFASAGHNEEALNGIREAVEKLGPIITLVQFAIELEVSQQHYQEAQSWVTMLPDAVKNQSRWLMQSGDLYAALEETHSAHEQWLAALKALDALPESRQKVPANMNLRAELKTRLRSTN
jgi:tetratricopeptide (TPR) repeat protein